jgi:hypothetical protein
LAATTSREQALRSACTLMQAGAHMVKLEGGGWTAPTVRFLVERGMPVCAHLGLTPQTVHALGGYRVQGKTKRPPHAARQALELQDAGAAMLVLEMVPAALSAELTAELPHCHTIGIGAGNGTAGQVLVMHDMLGVNLGKNPKFVHNFMQDAAACAAPWRPMCRPSSTAASPTTHCTPGKGLFHPDFFPCSSPTPFPNCAPPWPPAAAPPLCPPWATCTRGTCPGAPGQAAGRHHRGQHLCEPPAVSAPRRL